MRLWHKDLIPYLPKQQLLGQWRELNSVFSRKNRHILINFIYDDFTLDHLYSYATLVVIQLKCCYNANINQDKMMKFFEKTGVTLIPNTENIYKNKMNDRYLKQCLYNLQEKYDCGGITQNEWDMIEDRFGGILHDK